MSPSSLHPEFDIIAGSSQSSRVIQRYMGRAWPGKRGKRAWQQGAWDIAWVLLMEPSSCWKGRGAC